VQVSVTTVRLRDELPAYDDVVAALAPDELLRSQCLRDRRMAARYVSVRTFVRQCLSRSIGRPARELRLSASLGAKPSLERVAGDPDLRFSLSHSDDLAVIAIATGLEVGIDIERVREDIDSAAIARRYFWPHELEWLDAARSAADRQQRFFRYWVAKEAAVKALGHTLARSLKHCAVHVGPADDSAVARLAGLAGRPVELTLRFIDLAPGFCCAVAAAGRDWAVRLADVNAVTIDAMSSARVPAESLAND